MKVYRFKCEDCGSKQYDKLDETTYRCSYCGRTEELYFKKEQQEEQEEPQKNEVVSEEPIFDEFEESTIKHVSTHNIVIFILTILFGYVGVQHFMRGRILLGVVYLCTYGLCGIGWIIDIVRETISLVKRTRGNC